MSAVTSLIAALIIFLLSGIPLHISVRLLGGKTNILKTAMIVFLTGIITWAIKETFTLWGSLIAFVILIWIYHESFRLKWLKSLLAWFLQFVVIFFLYIILEVLAALLIGISILL